MVRILKSTVGLIEALAIVIDFVELLFQGATFLPEFRGDFFVVVHFGFSARFDRFKVRRVHIHIVQ